MTTDVIKRSCRVSGGNLPKDFKAVIALEVDFTGCTREELMTMAVPALVISWQGVARDSYAPEFVRELESKTVKVHARDCGTKILSDEEKLQMYLAVGVPKPLAKLMVKDPEAATKLMSGLEVPTPTPKK